MAIVIVITIPGKARPRCHIGARAPAAGSVNAENGPTTLEYKVIERTLRHLGLWGEEVRVCSGADPPPEPIVEPWFDDPFPDCDTEPVTVSSTWSLTSPCHSVTPFAMERQAFGFGLPPTRGRAESDFPSLKLRRETVEIVVNQGLREDRRRRAYSNTWRSPSKVRPFPLSRT